MKSWILFLLSLSGWEQNGFVFSKLQLFFFLPQLNKNNNATYLRESLSINEKMHV